MADRVRRHDWAATPLGSLDTWPPDLLSAVSNLLASRLPAALVWGSALATIYNDGFQPLLGDKPDALGRAFPDVWGEAWAEISPLVERAFAGESGYRTDLALAIQCSGGPEEAFFTVSCSPVRAADGALLGVLVGVVDTTATHQARLQLQECEAQQTLRLHDQSQLQEAETRFRALVTAGAYSIYRMSPDWRLMYQLDSQTLANTAEPIEDWVEKYILPEDLPKVREAIDTAIRTKSLFELEHRVRHADGGVGWVLSRAVPLLGSNGEITEWFGAGSDVTERRLAAEALRTSEERHRAELVRLVEERTAELQASRDLLQATMDSSPDMIQVFKAVRDEAGEIVDFTWALNNHTSESRYGEVRGERLLQRNPGVVEEGIFDAFKRVTETGVPEQAERHYVHEQFDGWFYQSLVKLGDGVATTTKEISDWKAAQAELLRLQEEVAQAKLRESEARLLAALESVPVGVAVIDTAGRTQVANAEYRRFLPSGVIPSRDAERGARWRSWDGDGQPLRMDAYPGSRALRGERVVPGLEMLFTDDDGREIWTSVATAPIRDDAGDVTGIVVVISDIDERKRALEALRISERQAHLLLAELQHRVRNILALVRSMIRRTGERARDADDFSAHLMGRIDALARTQALLTRAVGAGVSLEDLVQEELLSQAAAEQRATASGPRVVLASKAAEVLTLAIHELATNAVKYGALAAASGRIDVAWRIEQRGGEPWLNLEWTEHGVTILASAPRTPGFGTELITRRVPYELKGLGEIDLRPGGLVARLAFPLRAGESILETDKPAALQEVRP